MQGYVHTVGVPFYILHKGIWLARGCHPGKVDPILPILQEKRTQVQKNDLLKFMLQEMTQQEL